ncbi:MAG TPA: Sua5/YciO/YrdC/YwlC family protein [Candidatus Krumholzibacteria bacterium]|nr:Sua5/YciO/YrdC/YwlC family protein [Candidatus Krumholzibacteria bacterium]HPD71259.1 Sua5/YciO/YrdC/YwlC family protein [Candidatus Krumholzibacteria bacterium]HRY39041.1 Sua5/YciO/YrdC/YwlC family protein [Candidatus Krumholzibacteria bacterium]
MTSGGRRLDRAAIAAALAAGEVVLLMTDTVPGLHARIDRPAALAAVNALKGRREDQPLLVLAASVEAAFALAAPLAPRVVAYLRACWPGPFTVILPAAAGLPAAVAPAGAVAVRVPDWPALRELLAETGPLVSTSANRGHELAAVDLADAADRFPELAVWAEVAPAAAGAASAIVNLTGQRPRLWRPGPRPMPDWPDDA